MELFQDQDSFLPVGCDLKNYGRKRNIDTLNTKFENGVSVPPTLMYCAPRGMGKTALINSYFTAERIKKFAVEKKWLFQTCKLMPTQLTSESFIFHRLTERMYDALELLPEDTRTIIRESFRQIMQKENQTGCETASKSAYNVLKQCASVLHEKGYCISFIIDDFHHLFRQDRFSQQNLEALAELSYDKVLSYVAVADYYPWSNLEKLLDNTVSPWIRAFEFLELNGLPGRKTTKNNIYKSVLNRLNDLESEEVEDEMDSAGPVQITSGELEQLWELTGGIPGLLKQCLNSLYSYKRERGEPPDADQLTQAALFGCEDILRGWCSRMDDRHRETLYTILNDGTDLSLKALPEDVDQSSVLKDAGLLFKNSGSNTWSFNCTLFKLWLKQEYESRIRSAEKTGTAVESRGREDSSDVEKQSCEEMRDFFISYNNGNDGERARWIADTLRENGYTVYFQEDDCTPGMDFLKWMEDAIPHSRRFIAVWSKAYEKSDYCRMELHAATVRQHKKRNYFLLPVRVEDVPVENALFQTVVRVDLLSGDEKTDLAALLDAVKKQRLE